MMPRSSASWIFDVTLLWLIWGTPENVVNLGYAKDALPEGLAVT